MKKFIYNNKTYNISSFSGDNHNCVGIHIDKDHVSVVNTNNPGYINVFTYMEWEAFINGVKNNEFDLQR